MSAPIHVGKRRKCWGSWCFGRQLWLEAQRRGIEQAKRTIVIGDGAHWIWNLAAEHFPGATQILDWYHASTYVWKAAHALYGEGTDFAKHWARQHLDLLWNGQVATVIAHLEAETSRTAAIQDTLTYFRNNQHRMHTAHACLSPHRSA